MSARLDPLLNPIVESLMMHARLMKRTNGASCAHILCIAHVAWAEGDSPLEALAALRRHLARNLEPVMKAWEVLGPHAQHVPSRDIEMPSAEFAGPPCAQ